MSPSSPDPRAREPLRVRLSWPGDQPRPELDREEALGPEVDVSARDDSLRPEPDTVLRAMPVLDLDPSGSGALRRTLIDVYDRLADRVLHRLRAVGEEMDADLAELRSEMASLRQAVEDVGDRVQLRQIRAAVDELRSDIAGLRRTVLEWPELERVSADITSLRADMAELVDRRERERDGTPLELEPLRREVQAMRDELASEIASLRRRIPLRAGGKGHRVELTDAQVDQIVDALADRLHVPAEARPRR